MNLQRIAYTLHCPPPAYCRMTGQAEQRDLRNERLEQFKQMLTTRRIRKPLELIEKIKLKIRKHLYEMSLEELIEELKFENPEYDDQLIDSQTRIIYDEIIRMDQIEMIKEEPTILEYDSERSFITNKRKLKYQRNLYKTVGSFQVLKQERANPKLLDDDILRLQNQLNEQLKIQLSNENIKFKPIDIIYEDDEMDPISEEGLQEMKRNKLSRQLTKREKQLSTFRQQHIIHNVDSQQELETGRSEMQILEEMLRQLVGDDISFSQRSTVRPIKIKKNILQNLINFQGKLKKNIINKVLEKIKKDNNIYSAR